MSRPVSGKPHRPLMGVRLDAAVSDTLGAVPYRSAYVAHATAADLAKLEGLPRASFQHVSTDGRRVKIHINRDAVPLCVKLGWTRAPRGGAADAVVYLDAETEHAAQAIRAILCAS